MTREEQALETRRRLTSVWGIPFERTPYLSVRELKDLQANLTREAERQQENLALIAFIAYHMPSPKTKKALKDFFTGYAAVKDDGYGDDLTPVMRTDLKFALQYKKLSQAAFDMLTISAS